MSKVIDQPGPRTLEEWKLEERRLFNELVKAVKNGALNQLNIPFTVPRIPRTASDYEQRKFYANVCFQYRLALNRLT